MLYQGNIKKMQTKLGEQVVYSLPMGDKLVPMNEFVGSVIKFNFEGQINCIACGKLTKKSWGQGFCYPCMINAPENSPCILRPELCEAHLGKGRDPVWEEKNHNKNHVVYLAKSSAIKVGVTGDYPETRWMDQGASQAIILANVPYRQLAGKLEVYLKDYFTDKTNWRKMLKNEVSNLDIIEQFNIAKSNLSDEFLPFINTEKKVVDINYPVIKYPEKVKSLSFDKMPLIEATLLGIKGQYLLLEDGQVLNMRKHTGYFLSLEG